ncbi:hypothetical protein Cgig2_021272 [Carnegiea gigantea]|uniref:Uncharacterized protein n=1 Tax=Carnegiea gigantea TaxID=171969 RepID=A0A9Q1JX35_9CARY|nr:hypothetical protein Cgig2_021272 [Carnegiea gigantea]
MMFLMIRETKPLTKKYCPLSSIKKLMAGVIVKLFSDAFTLVYKGLNNISHSSHPNASGSHFPTHSLYAWLTKNFDINKLDGKASEAQELIGSAKGFHRYSSIIDQPRETLTEEGKLLRTNFAYFVSICSSLSLTAVKTTLSWRITTLIDSGLPTNLYFNNLSDPETMLYFHHVLTHCGTESQLLLLSDLIDTNISKDEGIHVFMSKMKIIHFGKPLEPFIPTTKDDSSHVKIPGVDVIIPTTHIPEIPFKALLYQHSQQMRLKIISNLLLLRYVHKSLSL